MRASLTPKQANIYVWGWQPSARFRYAVCGRRFGKTFLLREEMRRACAEAIARDVPLDNEIWYGAPTFRQAKRIFWRPLKRSIPREWLDGGRWNETECSGTLRSGHVVRLVGLDNYDALRGSGLFFFAGDEWADVDPAAWTEVIRPMLSTAGGHALFIGTPKGFDHFHQGYVAGQPGGEKDTRSWLYTTLEGGNVPVEEIERARKTLDERTFRQEYEAGFETFAGRVFFGFSRAGSVKPCPYDAMLPVEIGMDFNVNPMSATIWQRHGAEDWQVDEILLPTSNTDEMAGEILARFARRGFASGAPDGSHITIFPDPAGAQARSSAQGRTDISILVQHGFRVAALSSHPQVRDRINLMNARLLNADGERRAFLDPACVHSIEALERQVYRQGSSEPDKTGGFDHLNDASGYRFFALYGVSVSSSLRLNIIGR